jgi:hypothetical protein
VDPEGAVAVLSADHLELRQMIADVQARALSPSGDQGETLRHLHRLVIAATVHEAIEELHLWPTVRAIGPAGSAWASTAGDQELEQRKLLHVLDGRRPGDVDFNDLLAEFGHRAASHISFEETMVWPALTQALGSKARARLGRQLIKARRMAPTRPHPSAPARPGRHRKLGRSIALIDRNLDRLTARGR